MPWWAPPAPERRRSCSVSSGPFSFKGVKSPSRISGCVHSHGNWFNHHPHVHALVPTTYRTRSIRIESSSQHSPARKRTPENSRLGPYLLRIRARPFNSTRNGPFRRSPLRSCTSGDALTGPFRAAERVRWFLIYLWNGRPPRFPALLDPTLFRGICPAFLSPPGPPPGSHNILCVFLIDTQLRLPLFSNCPKASSYSFGLRD